MWTEPLLHVPIEREQDIVLADQAEADRALPLAHLEQKERSYLSVMNRWVSVLIEVPAPDGKCRHSARNATVGSILAAARAGQ